MIQAASKNLLTCERDDSRPAIGHVIHSLGMGGAERLVDQMVRRMARDFRCEVAVLDDVGEIGERLRRDGFVVEHLQRVPGIDLRCAERLRAFADRRQLQILHAHQCTPFFQAMLSRGLRGRRPVVLTEHGRHFPDTPGRRRIAVNRLLLRRRDRLFGCGEAVRRALIVNEGLPASRVGVIYNGVDLSELRAPSRHARDKVREEFGFIPSDFVVLMVARLHELKDHQTALRTIDRVRITLPGVRLLLVGDGDRRSQIEQTIQFRGLQNHVQLAGTRNDVAQLLRGADAFLLTSISEGIPLTVIEAMAARVPVVSTSVGGIPEMIRSGESGFLAGAEDDCALADSLIRLCCDAALRQSVIDCAERTARDRFSLDGMLDRYRTVYTELLNGRHRPLELSALAATDSKRMAVSNSCQDDDVAAAEQHAMSAEVN